MHRPIKVVASTIILLFNSDLMSAGQKEPEKNLVLYQGADCVHLLDLTINF